MSLIPFGFSLEQGILVDVSEAKKGRACKCICPSCKAPLLCRKGTINEWHFAHDPVFSDDKSYQDCEFSYEVSLRMMLRQLITEGDRIYLPEYHKYYAQVGKRVLVAKARTIEYKNAEIDVAECKTYGHFDARLTIQEKYLHVFVSYKARPFLRPADISLFCGILEINVEDFRKQKTIGIDSCKEQLKNVLLNESPFKRWRYHGREQRLEQEFERLKPVIKQSSSTAKNLQKINLNLQKKVRRDTTIIVTPQENSAPAKWRCVLCKIEYSGHSIGVNPCPQCGSHLYRVQLDNDTRHP